jgi:hypothetical protein
MKKKKGKIKGLQKRPIKPKKKKPLLKFQTSVKLQKIAPVLIIITLALFILILLIAKWNQGIN